MHHSILEGVFPRDCLLCGLPLALWRGFPGICPACAEKLPRPSEPCCLRCGKPLISEKDTCLRCRNSEYSFTENKSALLYIESGRRLVGLYKFNQERHLTRFLVSLMLETYQLMEKPDYIVPVPPDVRKLRKRGWDPVRLLAAGIASAKTPLLEILVKKKGKEQKTLDRAGRMANMRGRFAIRRRPAEGRDFLLVDDVFTTGATVSECARVLMENGAGRVRSLTLALDP